MNGQLKVLDISDIPPNPTKLAAWRNVCTDLRTALAAWHDITTRELPAFNALLQQHGIAPVPAPTEALPPPVCVAPATVRGRGPGPGA